MKARPFLKWAGGKKQLLPELLKRVQMKSYRTYYEPFLGGGALFFALAPNRAVICDANLRLIQTYKAVRDSVDQVIDILRWHQDQHSEEHFKAMRNIDVDNKDKIACAGWMIYLNKTGYNGLYRVNSKGHFNVPFGRYANPKILDEENLRACSELLGRAAIRCQDFRESLENPIGGDFVYLDPPYVPISETSSFTSYTAEKFTHEDQKDLAAYAAELKSRGVSVLLSNSSAPSVTEDLYPSFKIEKVKGRRSINSKASKRGPIDEYLISTET
jgi:DNA adenine methylase